MKRRISVFNSDQINLGGSSFPASELLKAEEAHQNERLETGLPMGLPVHIQHDMHRPVGWSQVLGHLVDAQMVRVIGLISETETDAEKAQFKERIDRFWVNHHNQGMTIHQGELASRVQPEGALSGATYFNVEACIAAIPNLAASLYPEFFTPDTALVDKDGLVDYRELRGRLQFVQPGVFRDPKRDLLLFAHRFFRRSLSHRNKLNEYFLVSFDDVVRTQKDVRPRLRLDPDIVGHPATSHHMIELEYWRGPRYSEDIASIRSGVAEHKADPSTKFYQGVDKTQIWWKSPETRMVDGAEVEYRTFEIEELIENESGGLTDEHFGCRYAHSEFSGHAGVITHFDGAIRAYDANDYLERIEKSIDRAGKHSDYTKLFRFDGPLPVEAWKRVLSDYFQGNPLVPEYLGASDDPPAEAPQAEAHDSSPMATSSAESQIDSPSASETQLCAFVGLTLGELTGGLDVEVSAIGLPAGGSAPAVETGCGAVDDYLASRIDLSKFVRMGSSDQSLDLAVLSFGPGESFPSSMLRDAEEIAKAIRQDIKASSLKKVALALRWQQEKLVVTLSLRGAAFLVADSLEQLFSNIDPTKSASTWIEPLAGLVRTIAPRSRATSDMKGSLQGRLSLDRPDHSTCRMIFPPELLGKALSGTAATPAPPA